jgi:hypothetical protein
MATKYAPASSNNNRNASSASNASSSVPIKTLRLGRIKAAVWENGADQRSFFNVTFARTYMDEEKKFHDADSFGRDDLLLLSKLADQAHTFICERQSASRTEDTLDSNRRG